MKSLMYYFFVVFIGHIEGGYVNKYEKNFQFECEPGKYIDKIISWHRKDLGDRLWDFGCRDGFVVSDNCTWTTHKNDYDEVLNYTCPNESNITGFKPTSVNTLMTGDGR